MSTDSLPEWIKRWITPLLLMASFIVMLASAFTFLLSVAWGGFRDDFIGALSAELNLENVATVHDVQAVREDIHDLRREVAFLRGDNQIVRIRRGRSYIETPVYRGEIVNLVLDIARTTRGESCTFIGATPIFEDTTGIGQAGSLLPATRQLTLESQRVRLELAQPTGLEAGRVLLELSMRFECDGVQVTEASEQFVYTLEEVP